MSEAPFQFTYENSADDVVELRKSIGNFYPTRFKWTRPALFAFALAFLLGGLRFIYAGFPNFWAVLTGAVCIGIGSKYLHLAVVSLWYFKFGGRRDFRETVAGYGPTIVEIDDSGIRCRCAHSQSDSNWSVVKAYFESPNLIILSTHGGNWYFPKRAIDPSQLPHLLILIRKHATLANPKFHTIDFLTAVLLGTTLMFLTFLALTYFRVIP